MPEHAFNNPAALDDALARHITDILGDAIATRGSATLVVSGGSTPKGLFARLANTDLQWDAVTLLLADERWVPIDHADSNERMVRELLLVNRAAEATLVSLIADYPDTERNLAALNRRLGDMDTFDVVILGMGGDSHTASLFPCSEQLTEGLTTDRAVLMTQPRTAPHRRISLSLARLSNTRHGLLHIVGDDKLTVLAAARAVTPSTAPIAAFVAPRGNFSVWYANKE